MCLQTRGYRQTSIKPGASGAGGTGRGCANASNSQIRDVLVFAVSAQGCAGLGQRVLNPVQAAREKEPHTTNGSAEGCADLGHRVSNPVQAARENSQMPQTVVTAHGYAVHTQRYIGASARHHARVMRLQGKQPDTETISHRGRGFMHGNMLQRCGI